MFSREAVAVAINKYDRMKDLVSIQERVNKLFEDIMEKDANDSVFHKTWSPLVDIYETEDEFVVKAELPEVKQEDVEIKIEANNLVLKGERKFQKDIHKNSFHRVERKYGFFKRSFRLPSLIDQDNIQANLKNGILKVVLPKKEQSGPMRIDIE